MSETSTETPHERSRRRRIIAAIAAAVAVLVIGAIVWAAFAGEDTDEVTRPVDVAELDDRPGDAGPDVEPGAAPARAGVQSGRLQVPQGIVLPGRPQTLGQAIGQPVEGIRLGVLSLAGRGFFVGTGPSDQIYVVPGEGVQADVEEFEDSRVELRGVVRPVPEDPAQALGLEEETVDTVIRRGAYVEASEIQVIE